MTITELPDRLIVKLSDNDWKYFRSGCNAFIAAVKAEIESIDRDYLNECGTAAGKHAPQFFILTNGRRFT